MMTRLNTLWLLIIARPSAAAVMTIVVPLMSSVRCIRRGSRSCVIAAEQLSISESAVDMAAAKIPARTSPTRAGFNRSTAMIGNANSASKAGTSLR